MNRKVLNKVVDISYNLLDLPNGRSRHFSFLVKRNNIVSMGWNKILKTHPIAFRYEHPYHKIHSELDCILNTKEENLSKLVMINVRIDMHNRLRISKPCNPCQNMLRDYGIKNVYFSTGVGFDLIILE